MKKITKQELDQRQKEKDINNIKNKLKQIDKEYNSDRSWREYVINNPNQFSTKAIDRMEQAEKEARLLRDELKNKIS